MINDDEINEFSPAEGGDDSVKEFNPYSEFFHDDEPSETSAASETGGEEHLTTESDIELPDFLRLDDMESAAVFLIEGLHLSDEEEAVKII